MKPLPQFDRPNDAELQWLQACLTEANQLIAHFSPSDAGQPITSAVLDRVWAAWLATKETEVQRINQVINAIAVAFGQRLVELSDFAWVVATDENGCEMAILALPGKGDVLSYPLHVVANRWPNRETDFLEAVEEMINGMKQKALESWETANLKQGQAASNMFTTFDI